MTDTAPSDHDFKRLLLASIPSLRAFALSLSGVPDRADDLLQETIMKAWAKQSSFEPGTNIKAWLFTILRNEFYSQMRKRGREIGDPDDIYTSQMAVQPSQHGAMDMEDFKKALAELSDDQREAIILVSASGFSYDEAAEICNCAVGTIKSRINRARARLQELLGIDGEGDFGPDAHTAAVIRPSALS
ncbi:sigma-70 family RNA polymerase sigma factor [Allorhizobium terrae]|uniref:RNA polymerase sigma factor n=1 Tax=Allorhizobium terrae TaxID=1848972 RepID=A0A4S3ZVD1_9HYPH|nr:sigma-70 family RNA polymerase sigma factor [Allorhizobium terrae]THF49717.1 sigma-70 family RNA polymerase sigma factor [Allorhizobium terrae]TWD50785.1 RNA polymerase sigma-70 factor (ECF subfamily) [Agrobacterium vitis]